MPVDAVRTLLRYSWFRFRLLSLPRHRRKRSLATARGWRKGIAFLKAHLQESGKHAAASTSNERA